MATPKVEKAKVSTGEEGEQDVFKANCRLYRFKKSETQWVERGRGEGRVLQHQETGKLRIILRESKTGKLRLNHYIVPSMELTANAGSDRAWTWAARDFSDGCGSEGEDHSFAIRFKTCELAESFKKTWDAASEVNKKIHEGAEPKSLLLQPVKDEQEEEAASESKEAPKEGDVKVWQDILKKYKTKAFDKAAVDKLWDNFDENKDGFIDCKELGKLLTSFYSAFFEDFSQEVKDVLDKNMKDMMADVLKQLDKNSDGKLSREEFGKIGLVQQAMSGNE